MNRSKDIEAEWITLAPGLAKSGFLPAPYRVPESYFQGFYDRLMMVIRTAEAGGFSDNYSIPSATDLSPADEIESISPLLAGLSRKSPYQVPDDYFSRFRVSEEKAAAIVADFNTALPLESGIQVSPAEESGEVSASPAPVIRMKQSRGWVRVAVAAAITVAVLTGAFFYLNNPAPAGVAGQLAQVSDQDMLNYLENHDMPLDNPADSAAQQVGANAPQSFTDNDIADLMSNVSDDELEHYYASTDGQESNLN